MKTQVLTNTGLEIYDQEIKDYITNKTADVDLKIDNLDTSIITNDDIDSIFDEI